ncbi:UDP-glucose 4-epimerase GalE [Candidatus Peregrinibacteria bacterium]|nr:MAG: UDP-glucose 4-epimerase GalE [Candidatus Peregrinibacteria bacterium]
MKELLVTGGAGYIGSNLVAMLIEAGYHVVIVDNLSTGHRELLHPDAIFYEGSLQDRALLDSVFARHAFEAVFHLAALSVVVESQSEPEKYAINNVEAGRVLLEVMLAHECARLIFSSSASVYGVPLTLPITEQHVREPVSVYGKTKMVFEDLLSEYETRGLRFLSFRYFNAAGASADARYGELHEPETHLIRSVFKKLSKNEAVEVYGTDYDTPDGTCLRDYLHVTDIAEAHRLGLEYLVAGHENAFVNLGTETSHSVLEVVKLCARVMGTAARIRECEPRSGDVPNLLASCDKARELLGWKATKNLQDMIESAWAFEKRHLTL